MFSFISQLISLEEMAKDLRKCMLGGRICYGKIGVKELIDEVNSKTNDEVIDYLKRLTDKGHTSILSHNVIMKNVNDMTFNMDIYNKLRFELLKYRCDYIDLSEQTKICLRYYLKGIPYSIDSNDLTINFRTIFESAKSENVNDLLDRLRDYEIDKIDVKNTYHLNTGGTMYIISKNMCCVKGLFVTFILEDVSRVLTHQLVRHKLDVEYSQKSQRYVRINYDPDKDDLFTTGNYFVIPYLNYIEDEVARREAQFLFKYCYDYQLEIYDQLIKMKVRPEDARYVLGGGSRTTIMTTMYSKETIDNFINLRKDNTAQWEIREIAMNLEKEINRNAK